MRIEVNTMKIYANTDYSQLEQFLGSDVWVLAYPKRYKNNFYKWSYINIISLDKERDTVSYLDIEADLIQNFIEHGEPITNTERDEIKAAVYLCQGSHTFIAEPAFWDVVSTCKGSNLVIVQPLEILTSDEILEMLDTCDKYVEPDEEFDDEDDIEE